MVRYFLMTMFTLFFLTGCSKQTEPLVHTLNCKNEYYSLKSAECIDFDRLVQEMEHYPVVFVGDHHQSREVHQFVAALITRLHQEGYTVSVANEWFTPENNTLLKAYGNLEINDGNFTQKIKWKNKTGYEFSSFSPIYHAAQKNGADLYGINMSKASREKISDQNLSGMSREERKFYDSLDLEVSAHRQLLAPFFTHCHSVKKAETEEACLERMYRVQVAWDTKMAEESAALSSRLIKTDKDKLIVFAGAFHFIYGLGINLRFARLSTLPFVTILPVTNETKSIETGSGDFLYIYQPAPSVKNAADTNKSKEVPK